MTLSEVIKLFEPKADITKAKVDTVGAGVFYYGWTSFKGATDATTEWFVVKETVAGNVTNLAVPVVGAGQISAWADRAVITYES